jgi:hypothetical protein
VEQYDHLIDFLDLLEHPDENQPHTLKEKLLSSFKLTNLERIEWLTEVGNRYFFCSPLPLVCYLEIVLPLRAGRQLSKIW